MSGDFSEEDQSRAVKAFKASQARVIAKQLSKHQNEEGEFTEVFHMALGMLDVKVVSVVDCPHRFMFFGTQKKRRCADCAAIEQD